MLYSIKALYLTVCLVCISVKVPENSSPEQDQNSRSQYTGRPIRAFDRTAIRAEKEQDRQCTYTTEARSRNHCCSGKSIRITYSQRVSVALVTQHAKLTRPVLWSFVYCPALQYFFHSITQITRSHFRRQVPVRLQRCERS